MARLILITLLISIAGCATGPQKAASIEDYCGAVAITSAEYALAKHLGGSSADVKFSIGQNFGETFPAHEIAKMHDTVDLVYSGYSAADIYQDCVRRRLDGTWFRKVEDGVEAMT